MKLYFFHFFDGKSCSTDDIGLELDSSEQAYLEAARSAKAMWSELLEDRCDPMRCSFHVADADGKELFRFEFAELVENCRAPQKPALRPTEVLARNFADHHRRVTDAHSGIGSTVEEVRKSLAESSTLLGRLASLDRRSSRP